jgi:hypothetical protein
MTNQSPKNIHKRQDNNDIIIDIKPTQIDIIIETPLYIKKYKKNNSKQNCEIPSDIP